MNDTIESLKQINKIVQVSKREAIRLKLIYYKDNESWLFPEDKNDIAIQEIMSLLNPHLKTILTDYSTNSTLTTLTEPEIILSENMNLIYFVSKGYDYNNTKSYYLYNDIESLSFLNLVLYLAVVPVKKGVQNQVSIAKLKKEVIAYLDK